MTPAAVLTGFDVPTGLAWPSDIAAGPDGNLWFTESKVGKIGRLTPAGVITEFPSTCGDPMTIAAGPDGNLWFTAPSFNTIGRITPSGAVTVFPRPTLFSWPKDITAGPDGNLWYTTDNWYSTDTYRIGRITPAGVIAEFALPTSGHAANHIAAGPDGNLWFTGAGLIGRITPQGVVTEFSITGPEAPFADAWGIVAGPDGNLWYTELNGNRIGQISTAGVVLTALPVPTGSPGKYSSGPFGIATGPDGALWFTESLAGRIGRIGFPAATAFYTLPPCRTLDTRDPGLGGPSPLAAGSQTVVHLAGRCGIPTGATAVAANVTVTAPTAAGNVRFFADGTARPLSSSLNYAAGQTRANNALLPLGITGATAVYVSQASGSVHLVLDVSGYFVP